MRDPAFTTWKKATKDGKENLIPQNSAVHTLCKWLAMIFQTCLNKGTYPKVWKTGQVTPIFKEGNKADFKSAIAPVSLLCSCSKIFWKNLLFDAIYELVKDQLHANQIRFPKNTDQQTLQLLVFLDKLYELNDNEKQKRTDSALLGFSKSLPYRATWNCSWERSHFFVVGGNLLKLIASYLTGPCTICQDEQSWIY